MRSNLVSLFNLILYVDIVMIYWRQLKDVACESLYEAKTSVDVEEDGRPLEWKGLNVDVI